MLPARARQTGRPPDLFRRSDGTGKTDTAFVVKSNDFVGARYDWTMLQQRMVLALIAQLRPNEEAFSMQRLEIREFLEAGDLKGNSYYERVREAAQQLLDQKIYVRESSTRFAGYNLLSYVGFDEKNGGYIDAKFTPEMRPYLLQLKRRFTKYELRDVFRFQSPYSVRVYELAVQFADIGHRTVLVEDLRGMLMLEDKYPRFSDFKRRVLDQAIQEIVRCTDLMVSYEVERKGRSAHSVRFSIRQKGPSDPQKVLPKRKRKKKGGGEDAQGLLDFGPPHSAATAHRPIGRSADEQAFRAWVEGLGEEEFADACQEAHDRLEPFIKGLSPASPSYIGCHTEELRGLWREGDHPH